MTLEALIQGCTQQNREAQAALYKKYASVLFAVCLKYSASYPEAEDNLQEAFLLIFEKVGQFKGTGSFEGWLKRVTVNHILQKYRRKKEFTLRDDSPLEIADDATEYEEQSIPLHTLLQFVQNLPNQYRLVFSLYVLDGYTHKDIATMLNISEGTSKSNLARARQILKKNITAYSQKNKP